MLKIIFARAPWLSVMLAAGGFSFALATSSSVPDDASAGARAIKTGKGAAATNPRNPMVFTSAILPGTSTFDLGDAAVGSAITRHITAKGGIPPRRFSSDRLLVLQSGAPEFKGSITLGEAINKLPAAFTPSASTAAVDLDGVLSGQIGGPYSALTPNSPLNFDVTVTDSRNLVAPLQQTNNFQVTMVDSSTFKFAQSALHDGLAYRQYHEKIEVVAGHAPYKFSLASVTVTDPATGIVTPYASLSNDLGLFLNAKTGKLVGRPLVAGLYSLSLTCTDAAGSQAVARNKGGIGQVITFNVESNTRVHSDLFATSMSIKGSVTTGGKDTIKYTGLVDLAGKSISSLNNSKVTLQIGDYDSPAVTIQRGKGTTAKGITPKMTVTVSSAGQLTITISGETFGTAASIIKASELVNTLKVLPVEVTIGNSFDASELLRFGVKARSDKFDLEYKFGPGNLGGGFLLAQVTGKDDTKSSTDADRWAVSFVTLPHADQKFDQIATATVGIGTDFTDTIAVGSKNTSIVSTELRDPTQADIIKLSLNNKTGKGAFTTGPLPKTSTQVNTATSIPAALNANGKQARFPVIITFNRSDAKQTEVFGAEGARAIFPRGSTWTNKDLSK